MAHNNGALQTQLLYGLGQIQGWVLIRSCAHAHTIAMTARIDHDEVEVGLQRLGKTGPTEAIIGQSVGQDQDGLCTSCPMIGQKTIGNIDPT
jgi:hypothetical protein